MAALAAIYVPAWKAAQDQLNRLVLAHGEIKTWDEKVASVAAAYGVRAATDDWTVNRPQHEISEMMVAGALRLRPSDLYTVYHLNQIREEIWDRIQYTTKVLTVTGQRLQSNMPKAQLAMLIGTHLLSVRGTSFVRFPSRLNRQGLVSAPVTDFHRVIVFALSGHGATRAPTKANLPRELSDLVWEYTADLPIWTAPPEMHFALAYGDILDSEVRSGEGHSVFAESQFPSFNEAPWLAYSVAMRIYSWGSFFGAIEISRREFAKSHRSAPPPLQFGARVHPVNREWLLSVSCSDVCSDNRGALNADRRCAIWFCPCCGEQAEELLCDKHAPSEEPNRRFEHFPWCTGTHGAIPRFAWQWARGAPVGVAPYFDVPAASTVNRLFHAIVRHSHDNPGAVSDIQVDDEPTHPDLVLVSP